MSNCYFFFAASLNERTKDLCLYVTSARGMPQSYESASPIVFIIDCSTNSAAKPGRLSQQPQSTFETPTHPPEKAGNLIRSECCLLQHKLGSSRCLRAVGQVRNVDESTVADTVVRVADDQRLALAASDGFLVPRVPKRHHRADSRHRVRGQGVRCGADNQGSLGVP